MFQLTLDNYHASLARALAYRLIDWAGTARSLRLADAVWTPSRYTAQAAAKLFPRQRAKLAVLPNAVPWRPADPATPLPAGLPARYWLAVGAREPRKNMPWFVEQWRQARERQPDLPALALVARPQELPAELRRLDDLIWLKELDDATLRAVYAAAERLWRPSYAEGFGLPVIEALAQGTPVAVATGSALDEIAPPRRASPRRRRRAASADEQAGRGRAGRQRHDQPRLGAGIRYAGLRRPAGSAAGRRAGMTPLTRALAASCGLLFGGLLILLGRAWPRWRWPPAARCARCCASRCWAWPASAWRPA